MLFTAPVVKDRRLQSPGAPSPDHPVCGPEKLATEVDKDRTCGTPRRTPGFWNPSTFSRINPNARRRRGFSRSSQGRIAFRDEQGVVALERSDERRVQGEIVLHGVAGPAGPPVAVEGLVEEQVFSAGDETGAGEPVVRRTRGLGLSTSRGEPDPLLRQRDGSG